MTFRPTVARVDPRAIERNIERLGRLVTPAEVCVVVKADGYGHGADEVARAALRGGATWLAVALVEEGLELRDAGIDAPVLVLSEAPAAGVEAAVAAGLRLTVYSVAGVDAAASAASAAGVAGAAHPVHLKVDTGMRRVGCRPDQAVALADAVVAAGLTLEGLFTHLPVADEPDNDFTGSQLESFNTVVADVRTAGHEPALVHAANSAGAIAHPAARLDLVRIGIAAYGIAPSPDLDGRVDLEPALSLRSAVTFVKGVEAGDGVSYGHHHRFPAATTVATVPVGYADGVPRRLGVSGGEVLIGGARRPIVGVVTMDQLMVDCGTEAVEEGDEVVLLGRQGDLEVTAQEWALRVDTIAYEIVCGLSPRVPRTYGRS